MSSLQSALDLEEGQLKSALEVSSNCQPQDVWLVRDYLEQIIQGAGRRPTPYTHLTASARSAASAWFPLRTPPPLP